MMEAMRSSEFEMVLARLAGWLEAQGLSLVAAESCTGGWVGKLCSDHPGSSAWFEAALVTYSDDAKRALLGVDTEVLRRCGAVSKEVALEMSAGALERTAADVAVAVTGIAGPSGGILGKPVGSVWIAWRRSGTEPAARHFQFEGGRSAVRLAAAQAALTGLPVYLTGCSSS